MGVTILLLSPDPGPLSTTARTYGGTEMTTADVENLLLNGVETLTKATLTLRETTASLRASTAADTPRHADEHVTAGGEMITRIPVFGPA